MAAFLFMIMIVFIVTSRRKIAVDNEKLPLAEIWFSYHQMLNDDMEIQPDDIEIHQDQTIGEGAFGIVQRGTLKSNNKNIAIKMLQGNFNIATHFFIHYVRIANYCQLVLMLNFLQWNYLSVVSEKNVKSFMDEIQLMKAVGHHENIVSIVGYSRDPRHGILLLTEFCSKGNLLDYLR